MLTEEQAKLVIFEIYSAGFTDGYNQQNDIKTSFENYYNMLLKEMIKNEQ